MYKNGLDSLILFAYNINITINCKIIYMITKISFSNFYSIGDEREISFLKGGIYSEKDRGYFQYKKREKVSLINGFFGSNASGKSTVLRAISTIMRLIFNVNNSQDLSKQLVLVRPNSHKKYENKSTKLGMDFLLGSNYYQYNIEIENVNTIVREELLLTTLDKKNAKAKKIFLRTKKNGISFGSEYQGLKDYLSLANIEDYQSFISHLINNVNAKAVADFINYRKTVAVFLKTDGYDVSVPIPVAILNSALKISSLNQDHKQAALKLTQEMMSCFDESIEALQIINENNQISIKVKHRDFIHSIDMLEESAGTRELFSHIFDIISTFKTGGVVVYDETNRYFHPDIEIALLSLFANKEFNLKNSQLFFASHNHDTMDLLDINQTFIVEKQDMSSLVYKLAEIENAKQRDNIKKKYRLGLFGGSPDISLFDYRLKQLL